MEKMIKTIGLIAARKSSKDISLAWAVGVFTCMVLMLPSGLISSDAAFRVFTVMNFLLFSVVVVQSFRYR